MGIINVTPDSFFHATPDPEEALEEARSMPADILDIGGQSTRPGSHAVTEEEEIRRVRPLLEALGKEKLISLDTYQPAVAKIAIENGCRLINDVTGCENPAMRELIASSGAAVIVMHSRGLHEKMGHQTTYDEGLIPHLLSWFEKRVALLQQEGIAKEKIILDPGIGFDKTAEQNYEILRGIKQLKTLGLPLLIGLSRKSFLKKSLSATIAANTYALLQGADIIRVHDVKEAREAADFVANIQAIQ